MELRWLSEPPSVTPYAVADAAIFDGFGRLLLVRREDDGLWAIPGGACQVGETPAEAAARELFEETGIRSTPTALVGVYDSRLCGTRSRWHLYHFVFVCKPQPGEVPISGPETTDVGWFAASEIPALSPGRHPARIADVFDFVSTEGKPAFFDTVGDA